ncbi:uncharacterized protein GIQ15_05084 [Arthroderma uncinatum]|uniref:uncharacterized protein n=1 Tax=Arthroderma uncinatum TaxID=74035 RepID=UPI00144A9125|nr:uncharacterized protein GIQ15_05084 [Arthroderma uncinatum]KAF3482325.1 hypothetical protein GIQ15_05084 [Arthroderma uncinatum]
MSSKEIHIVAIVTPKPGKQDEVAKLLAETAEKVKANEPGALIYYGLKSKKSNEIIVIEKYADMEAVKAHGGSGHFQAWSKAVAPLLEGPSVVKFASQIGGFESKL